MKPSLLICLGIVLFGIAAFFRKFAVDRLHPYQLQIINGYIYLILMPIWFYLAHDIKPMTMPGIFYACITTLFGIAGGLAYSFILTKNVNPGVAAALLGLSPVVTIAMSTFFFHESLSIWKILAFTCALASAILVNF
jgi:drug/metabolite transporter (DMT)-like permease